MFGMGMPELLVVLVIALLVLGVKRLPEVGSSLGKAIRGFKACMEQGSRKTAAPIATASPCYHCGQPAPGEARFCPRCGNKLGEGRPVDPWRRKDPCWRH